MTTVRRSRAFTVALGLAVAACRDATDPPATIDPGEDAEQLILSGPVVRGTRTVVYVSMAPGAYLEGRTAIVTNARTGQQRTETLVVGGLDPVSLDAVEGDTVLVAIDAEGGQGVRITRAVPGETSLAVVRTEPAVGAAGVPLAARIVLVFSEPLDAASLIASARLLSGGHPVPGSTTLSTDALTATYTPSGELVAETDYSIEVGTGIRGAGGARPDSAVTVRFRTGPAFPPPPGTYPPVPAGARAYVRTAPHRLPVDALSRYLLYGDTAFALQYVKQPTGFLEYTGRIVREGDSVDLFFDANAGQWRATGSLSGDLLTVAYNTDMTLSDFEDGAYRLASQGPWMPPVSDQLAFDRGGDIYLSGGDGNGGHRLTSGADWDNGAAWSPDGERVAFTRTRADGTPESETGIYLIGRDGTDEVRLSASGPGTHDAGPSWSPDGTRIAFQRKSGPDAGGDPYYQDKFEIYVMNADGSDPVRLTHHRSLSFGPAWSPDGRRIAYASWDYERFEWMIRVMNADGTDNAVLSIGGMSRPAWSPDGTRLVFSGWECPGGAGTCEWGRSFLFTVTAEGSGRRRLTDDPNQEWAPAWSPDGTRIAFTADRCTVSGCTRAINTLRFSDGLVTEVDGTLGADGPSWRPALGSSP